MNPEPKICLHCHNYTSDGLCSHYFGVLKYIFTPERLPGSLRPSVNPEDTCPQWTSNEE